MAQPALRPARYEDLFDLPENVIGEILGGELHVSPRPAPRHGHVSYWLGTDLGAPFGRGRGGPGGWSIYFEPELHLGEDVLIPDLAGWRKERLPRLPETAWFETAPDWVCEVLSPSTAVVDRARKLPIYARAGVHWMWLVDPLARTVEVFDLSASPWGLLGIWEGAVSARLPPFDAIELDLGGIWPEEPPEPER
ncbi:MAG: Uma2 family endonuclease [Alphaproteobacteria bacterium]|nr:Uma2 family endonuclease [Alphaproteobacteria bacterium]